MGFRGGRGKQGDFKIFLDFASLGLLILSASIFLFASIDGPTAAIGTFLMAFLGLGLVLMLVVNRGLFVEPQVSGKEGKQEIEWFLGCMVTILGASAFISNFPAALAKAFGLSITGVTGGISNAVITLEIAAPEEVFFRGMATPFFAQAWGKWAGATVAAAFFMIYHFFVYGDSPGSLVFVFVAGFVFSIAVLSTGRLTISLAAHFFNNFLSLGLPSVGGVPTSMIPSVNPDGPAVRAGIYLIELALPHLHALFSFL